MVSILIDCIKRGIPEGTICAYYSIGTGLLFLSLLLVVETKR